MAGKPVTNEQAWKEICRLIPGGVDANAKVFPGPMPVIAEGEGPWLIDVEGRRYLDYCAGYGPLIFGHADRDTMEAARRQLARGVLYGLPHTLMAEASRRIAERVPCVEMVRFTASGTEATLHALRLARAVTGREKIVKFHGGFHGGHEYVLWGVRSPFDAQTLHSPRPDSAGVPGKLAEDIFVLPFNDSETAEALLASRGEEIAAVIVEPVLGAYGIPAEREFLQALRRATERAGALLIFDEVITGFRLHRGGAQALYGVVPDLVALGKALAAGLPIGAFGGPRRYMEAVAPAPGKGPEDVVFHSGTYTSNPLSLAVAVASLDKLDDPGVYEHLNGLGERLRSGISALFERHGVRGAVVGAGSIVQWYLGVDGPVRRVSDVWGYHREAHMWMHRALLDRGVFFIPNPRGFVSTAHTEADIDMTLEAFDDVLRAMKAGPRFPVFH